MVIGIRKKLCTFRELYFGASIFNFGLLAVAAFVCSSRIGLVRAEHEARIRHHSLYWK